MPDTLTIVADTIKPLALTWQPIETAPEGLLLLYRPRLPANERIAVRRAKDWCGPNCCRSAEPTHWMPLPDTPRASEMEPVSIAEIDSGLSAESDLLMACKETLSMLKPIRAEWLSDKGYANAVAFYKRVEAAVAKAEGRETESRVSVR